MLFYRVSWQAKKGKKAGWWFWVDMFPGNWTAECSDVQRTATTCKGMGHQPLRLPKTCGLQQLLRARLFGEASTQGGWGADDPAKGRAA